MKKILVLGLIILFVVLAYFIWKPFDSLRSLRVEEESNVEAKKTILRIGLVADSHNENELLGKALEQAEGMGINFVIGLGDYTNLGTIDELTAAKNEFDASKLEYFVIPGDRDGWESRQKGLGNATNFLQVFYPKCHSRESGNLEPWTPDQVRGDICGVQVVEREGVQFVLLDNSNLYKGIGQEGWEELTSELSDLGHLGNLSQKRLRFVFAHKTPFHPDSSHIMGEDSEEVSRQARKLMGTLEDRAVDGFFSGDLHFFAQFNSPNGSVKMTTVGAVASDRNFQGPRFAILTVFEDYSWEVEDVEIR